jgi:hypothetical protein
MSEGENKPVANDIQGENIVAANNLTVHGNFIIGGNPAPPEIATLSVRRTWSPFSGFMFRYQLFVDDQPAVAIAFGQTKTFTLPAGKHRLHIVGGLGYQSDVMELYCSPGSMIQLVCGASGNSAFPYYIRLER